MSLLQDRTLLHVTPSSAFFRLDNLKLMSSDNSAFTRADFHDISRDKIKLDQLKIALEVIGHASLLQLKIGISECSVNVIEQ
jgi:hypothetical protein